MCFEFSTCRGCTLWTRGEPASKIREQAVWGVGDENRKNYVVLINNVVQSELAGPGDACLCH